MVNFVVGIVAVFFFWPGVIWCFLFVRALVRAYRKRHQQRIAVERFNRGVCPDCGKRCVLWLEYLQQRHKRREPQASLRN